MVTDDQPTPEDPTARRQSRGIKLWLGMLLAAIAYFSQLFFANAMVEWACYRGSMWVLHLITIIALLVAALGAYLAWTGWHEEERLVEHDGFDSGNRIRFMGWSGLILSALFGLGIIVQEIPTFIVGPCVGR